MQMFEEHQLVAMSRDELNAHIIEVGAARHAANDRVALMTSPIGIEAIKRWKGKLDAVLGKYGRIAVQDKTDRDIVLALIEQMVSEKMIRGELKFLQDAPREKEVLDFYQELCSTVNRSKDKRRSVRR